MWDVWEYSAIPFPWKKATSERKKLPGKKDVQGRPFKILISSDLKLQLWTKRDMKYKFYPEEN